MYLEADCTTCASLRAAMMRLVGEDGLAGVSLPKLSEFSGRSTAEIREHYPSIAACLNETYDELGRGLLLDFADAFERSDSWDEGLMLGQSRMLARMAEHPAEARLYFVEVLRGDRELLQRRDAVRRQMLDLFVAQHRRWCPDGGELPEMQLELLMGASFQLISARVAQQRIEYLPELAGELDTLAGMFEPVAA